MVTLLDHRERAIPGEVEPDPVLVAIADQADPLQRLDDLDPVRTHLLLESVGGHGVGEPDRPLAVPLADGGVRVDDPQVGIEAHAADQKHVAAPVVGVEVAAVVEVAVGGADLRHGPGHLVYRVLVHRRGHRGSLFGLVGVGSERTLGQRGSSGTPVTFLQR